MAKLRIYKTYYVSKLNKKLKYFSVSNTKIVRCSCGNPISEFWSDDLYPLYCIYCCTNNTTDKTLNYFSAQSNVYLICG
jgi:hypothetical protein